MKPMHVRFPEVLIWFFLIIQGCAVEETGSPPPTDVLYYPGFAVAHPQGRYLYINNTVLDRRFNAGTLSVYDTFEHRLLEQATLDVPLFGGRIALVPHADETLYAVLSDRDQHTLSALGIAAEMGDDDAHIAPIESYSEFDERPMARDPFDIATDVEGLLVGHLAAGVVSRWHYNQSDEDQFGLVYGCSLTLPGGAHQVVRHPMLGWWYVADRLTSSIWIVSERPKEDPSDATCQLTIEGAINLGNVTSRALTFNPQGSRLFVVSSTDGALRMFDTTLTADGQPKNELIGRIALGDNPLTVKWGPCGGMGSHNDSCDRPNAKTTALLYVPLFSRNEVAVVDPDTLTIVARIKVGQGPYDIVFMTDAQGRMKGYVTHFVTNELGELDLEPGSENRFTTRAYIR